MTTAHIDSICAACKRAWPIELTQAIAGNQLVWKERFACECGHGFEAAGAGLPTPGVRKALLAQLGKSKTYVDAMKSKPTAVKVLALLKGVTEAEVTKSLKKLPAVGYEGTAVEAEFVAHALKRAGATVRVVKIKKRA
jgi:hypothetical protein